MSPRTWFCLSLSLVLLLTACQPIPPVATTPTPATRQAATVASTGSTGSAGCPAVGDQPLDLIIAPQWQEGEVSRYQVEYKNTPVEHGKAQPTITTSYTMAVTVLEANDAGYVLEWNYIAMLPGPIRLRLEYSATPYGEFIELRNLDELTAILGDEAEKFAALIAGDVQAFHAVYGLYFTGAEPYTLGQDATPPARDIPGTDISHISLTRYGAAEGCLQLVIKKEWHASAKEFVSTYTVGSSTTFELDLKTGWLQKVSMTRSNLVDGSGYNEEMQVTYLPPVE